MARAAPSIAWNSFARGIGTIAVLIAGFIVGVITARALGPAGKGTLSAINFIGDVMLAYACLLGLGEAAIILIGQQRTTQQDAVSSSIPVLAITGLGGLSAMLLVSIPAQWSGILLAVVIEGITVQVLIFMMFFRSIVEADEDFGASAKVTIASTCVMALLTVAFVGVWGGEIVGATAAGLGGAVAGLGAAVVALRRRGLRLRPRLNKAFVVSALRLGLPIQAAYLLIAASQRVDQLVVYSLAGETDAGRYAVALTVGQFSTFAAGVISMAAFPRIANLTVPEVSELASQVFRVTITATLAVCVVVVPTIPFLIPALFGPEYAAAVVPAEILVLSGVLWSGQWTLTRVATARAQPALKAWTFGANVAVMLALDLILVPSFGTIGAAVASVCGCIVGVTAALISFRKVQNISLRSLIPGRADVAILVGFLRAVVTAVRQRGEIGPLK